MSSSDDTPQVQINEHPIEDGRIGMSIDGLGCKWLCFIKDFNLKRKETVTIKTNIGLLLPDDICCRLDTPLDYTCTSENPTRFIVLPSVYRGYSGSKEIFVKFTLVNLTYKDIMFTSNHMVALITWYKDVRELDWDVTTLKSIE